MANDTTLRHRDDPGSVIYTQIESPDGSLWNGTGYVAAGATTWAAIATSTPEDTALPGRFVCQFPLTSPAGNYLWVMYKQAGGSPASTDTRVAEGQGYWDGTTFGGADPATVWAHSSRTLSAFGFAVTATAVSNPVQVDLTQAVPVRNQDSVTAPNLGDALLGAWTEPFAKESADATTGAYTKKLPDSSGPVRAFTLTTDINGNVTAR